MSLKSILDKWAIPLGYNPNNALERDLWIRKINIAAEEVYNMTDLIGSLREQVFEAPEGIAMLTLPYYVANIRAVRHYDSLSKIQINDMRPHYFYGSIYQSCFTWREKNKVAIRQSLSNESLLTIRLINSQVSDEQFTVTVVGSTDNSERISETLTFNQNDNSKTTSNQFTGNSALGSPSGIRAIIKNKPTKYNLEVLDASGNIIAEIPNSEVESQYTVYQVYDNQGTPVSNDCLCFQVLYKFRFTPFKDDYDNFPCEGYDDAIGWKLEEHSYSKQQGMEQNAILAHEKCLEVILQRQRNAEMGIEKEIQFGPNRYLDCIGTGGRVYLEHDLRP